MMALLLLASASGAIEDLLAWLSQGRLSPWGAVIEADLADPQKGPPPRAPAVQLTGVRFSVVLRTESVDYQQAFDGHFRTQPSATVVTASSYTSPLADPTTPILYTFGAREDGEGVRVLVSASGGRPDEQADRSQEDH